jgi:hypothetical protein
MVLSSSSVYQNFLIKQIYQNILEKIMMKTNVLECLNKRLE